MSSTVEFLESLLFECAFSDDDATHDALLASYVAEALSETTSSVDELTPSLLEFAATEALCDDDAADSVAQWLAALRAHQPLMRAFDLIASLSAGAECVALHPVDNDWHAAHVVKLDLAAATVDVRYDAFAVSATLPLRDVRSVRQLVDAEHADDALCELCLQSRRRLTAHHLYPRSEHARLLKKGALKETLTHTLAMICRPCHNAVHRAEDNRTLAADWHSVDKLRTHPSIVRWLAFWSKDAAAPKCRSLTSARKPSLTHSRAKAPALSTFSPSGPEVEKWAQQFPGVKFVKVDVDQLGGLSARFGVRAMPTFKLLNNQAVVGEVVGANVAACLQELQKLQALAGAASGPASFAGHGHRLGGSAPPPPRSSGGAATDSTVTAVDEDDFVDDESLVAGGVVPSLPLQPPAPSVFLDELVAMGFSKAHAAKAVRATGDRSIDAAVDWIFENPEPAGAAAAAAVVEPVTAAAPTTAVAPTTAEPTTEASTSTAVAAGGDASSDAAQVNAMVASEGETKEAFEVRKKQFVEKLAKIRAAKAQKEEQEKRDAELKRVREAKESQAMREQWASQKDRIEAERAKKEKAAELAHKQNLKRQVEQDKLNRKAEREAKQAGAAAAGATAAKPASAPVAAAAPTGEKKVYTEAQVSVQLPTGLSIEKSFPVDTTVADVAQWVREASTQTLVLVTPFPRVTYDTLAKQATKLNQIDGFVPRGKFLCKAP